MQPQGKQAVAQAAANNHRRRLHGIQPCRVLWENTLARRIQPTDAGQTELAAVRMPAKHQIYARLRICSKALWMMRQKDPKVLLTFQQPAERWEQNLLPISPAFRRLARFIGYACQ